MKKSEATLNTLTRKEFFLALFGSSLSFFLPKLADAEPQKLGASEIAPGIFVHRGRNELVNANNHGDISNPSFVVGSSAVAVIDTGGSALIGTELRAAIGAITPLPIRYVINTHMHPDHVMGNAAFEGPGVEFVGHRKLPQALAVRSESYLRAALERLGEAGFAGTKIVMPTKTVDDTLELDLGGRVLKLTARPTAHTDNDLTIYDKASDTFFPGDLLFSEHIPTLDGSIVGWLKLIGQLKTETAARAVPGHGPVSMKWPEAIEPVERYLSVIAADVRAQIKAGNSIEEAVRTAGQSEKDKWQLFDENNARNVTAAFAELEWE